MVRPVAFMLAAALLLVPMYAIAAEAMPSRAEYVERVEPICRQNAEANDRILAGARDRVKDGQLPAAGRQFIRASAALGKAIERIAAIPRPVADESRLVRWVRLLDSVEQDLGEVGRALLRGEEVRANHDAIRAERHGNAANNVVFLFEFDYCRFKPSRFS